MNHIGKLASRHSLMMLASKYKSGGEWAIQFGCILWDKEVLNEKQKNHINVCS